MRTLSVTQHALPLLGEFRISRSSLSTVSVVRVVVNDGTYQGRGECRPYGRYDETPQSVITQIEGLRDPIEQGLTRQNLQNILPPGAARNAVDCALWDLAAKQSGLPVWELLGLNRPRKRRTTYTVSIDTPGAMANAAKKARDFGFLKIKINANDVVERCRAVIQARPDAKLVIDANEALDIHALDNLIDQLPNKNIALIEQPLPHAAVKPGIFNHINTVLICADESLHIADDLEPLWEAGYRSINIKLDKSGGLTQAHIVAQMAASMGFHIMAGCMVSSSLAVAPMMMLESYAKVLDLDGPILLKSDIENGLKFDKDLISPPHPTLWG